MKSSLGSASEGSPNSVLPAYCALVLATGTRVGRVVAAVAPSAAVARRGAQTPASACITPFWSMVAIAGVSDVHTNVVAIVVLLASARRANNCCSKPTGNAGSKGVGPEKLTELPPAGGASTLHAPNVEVASVQVLV